MPGTFNPTLVQFKRRRRRRPLHPRRTFNPTLVQFKPVLAALTALKQSPFNPTLVQFKRDLRRRGREDLAAAFQSYLSPIQTAPTLDDAEIFPSAFNPTLVQFKQHLNHLLDMLLGRLSILP